MNIKDTKGSPSIYISIEECKFEIKGSSYSESVDKLFDDIINLVEKEIPNLSCELDCIFKLYVISSITQKKILYLVSRLNNFFKSGKKIKISWYVYDDEDNLEFAEELIDIFNIPIKIFDEAE